MRPSAFTFHFRYLFCRPLFISVGFPDGYSRMPYPFVCINIGGWTPFTGSFTCRLFDSIMFLITLLMILMMVLVPKQA
jgi:hypothetical protein